MAEQLSIDIEFPEGRLDWGRDNVPPEKLLQDELRTADEHVRCTNPVLCGEGHGMTIVNMVPVKIRPKILEKIFGYYCRVCDRYKIVGVEPPR